MHRPLLLLLAVLACSRPAATQPRKDPAEPADSPHVHIGVETVSGARYALDVEIAANDAQRERGLMFRRAMSQNAGMIFLFDDDRVQKFWMKNTFLSLDMIFIGADGRIVGIVPEATPQTETVRSVGKPSRYVLEVNGGWAALKGVHIGDRVELSEALSAPR